MERVLVLLHLDESGKALPKAAFEVISAGLQLAQGARLVVGLIGNDVQFAADSISGTGARILAVSGEQFSQARYATDAAAAEALCRASEATIVVALASSRFSRVLPGVAHRLNGAAETHVTAINGELSVSRWFYRQRVEATLSRAARPWFLLIEQGAQAAWHGDFSAATIEKIQVTLPTVRTTVTGVRTPKQDQQTIRPDAKLLFVAGAGWTKKKVRRADTRRRGGKLNQELSCRVRSFAWQQQISRGPEQRESSGSHFSYPSESDRTDWLNAAPPEWPFCLLLW
jgi:electron transfer flavoprotein alpha subunit